jgi:hypothetical protein
VCRRKSRLLKTGTPDKHVDVCVESDEDRGSTPLASSPESFRACRAVVKRGAGCFCEPPAVLVTEPGIKCRLESK